MNYLGIDPGLTGALALINRDGTVELWDTPTIQTKVKGKTKNLFAEAQMADLLWSIRDRITGDCQHDVLGSLSATIEAVHSMPEQGISSAFNFGRGFGTWIGILAALRIPTTFVSPQAWKKKMLFGTAGKDKDASRLRAMQLFPSVSEQLKLKKHDGRAEALLIATYLKDSPDSQYHEAVTNEIDQELLTKLKEVSNA